MVKTADELYRGFVVDGVPSSGPWHPHKPDIREWGTYLERLYEAAQAGGGVVFQTLADANADLNYAANQIAWVVNDATAANNGIYQKQGASGTGSWLRINDLPYNVVFTSNVGAGTADDVVVTSSLPIGTSMYKQLIAVHFTEPNTGAMTLAVNAETPRDLVTNTGTAIPANYVQPAMAALVMIDENEDYRFFSYGDASAIQAAAEAARDEAVAAAASVVIKDYATVADVQAATVSASADFVQVAGYSATGDGGGALYRRVGVEPTHEGKIQSADGAWWENSETVITPQMFAAVADGVTVVTDNIINLFSAASTLDRKVYFPAGTYLISGTDETYNGSLDVELHPDAIIKGTVSQQFYTGDGSTTSFQITVFPDLLGTIPGLNTGAEIIDDVSGLVDDQLTQGVDYSLTGDIVDLSGGSAPFGAPANGKTLHVYYRGPILRLRALIAEETTIHWKGGTVDCSQRGGADPDASGSGLDIYSWHSGSCDSIRFFGSTDYEQARVDRVSDTGLTILGDTNFVVTRCYFRGFLDLGAYFTGDAAQVGGRFFAYGNVFEKCATGSKAIRGADQVVYSNNHFIECGVGLLNSAEALPSGDTWVIDGNTFEKCGRRGLDLRGMNRGVIVSNNIFIDLGYKLDGTTPYELASGTVEPSPAFVYLAGCPGSIVTGNIIRRKNQAGTNNQRGVWLLDYVDFNTTTHSTIGTQVKGNFIQSIPNGIFEHPTGTFTGNDYDNTMQGVGTPMTLNGGGNSLWRYLRHDTGEVFQGRATIGNGVTVGKENFGAANAGIVLDENGTITATRDGGTVQSINRLTSDGVLVNFLKDGTSQGNISIVAGATNYNSTSDKNLKTNPRPFDSGAILDAIEAWQFDWKAGGSGYGVLAQDCYEVFPDAISPGEDGNPWMADYSKFVPLLLAEIKSLRARVETLESS